MNKLELTHIIPFYQHNLIVAVNDGFARINGLQGPELISIAEINAVDAGMYVRLDEIKPCLRPLADLVKENPETGKPFFIEVLKASCEMPFEGKNNKFWKPLFTGSRQVTIEQETAPLYLEIDNLYNDYSFSIDLSNGDLSVYRNDELATTDNQAQYFRELARLHFDTDNLIGKGLAISKAS